MTAMNGQNSRAKQQIAAALGGAPFPDGRPDPARSLASMAADLHRSEQAANSAARQKLLSALKETWPAQLAKTAYEAATLPGDVYAGRVNPMSDEGIGRSFELAGLMTLGAGAMPAGRNEMRMGIKAYHGSPHDFDRFDMSKIGTGEGAQAYGHGLYFAEKEGIAQGYRDALSGKIGNVPVMMDGVRYTPPTDQHQRVAAIIAKDGRRAAMENYRSLRDQGILQPEQDAAWKELLSSTKGKTIEAAPAGRMYEVELNTTPDRLLDWDKPLSGQPQAVREALIKSGQIQNWPVAEAEDFGSAFYRRAAAGENIPRPGRMLPQDSATDVTSKLNEAGIDGIKYLDAGSRAAGDGSRNYVMFNDKLINILRKYGVATAAALPAAGLAELGITAEEARRSM